MRLLNSAIVVTVFSASVPTHAAVYVFSDSQSSSFADLAVATLSIDDIVGGTRWTLSGIYDAKLYPSAFLRSISYDYSGNVKNKNSLLPMTSMSVSAGKVNVTSYTASSVSFTAAAGESRFTSGDAVQWTFQNTNSSQFSNLSAHVNAINNGNSIKFNAVLAPISPVPEPATWLMSSLGAIALIGMSRSRRRDGTR